MNLFNELCDSLIEEMAFNRGKVGRPKEIPNTPSFAGKEKYGIQAGKYTGSQMLQILGDFLKTHGDTESSYEDLAKDLYNYLSSQHNFKGTAAKYWTRTLSDAIFKFNHKVETAAEDEKAPEVTEPNDVESEIEGEEPSVGSEMEPTPEEETEVSEIETPSFSNPDLSELFNKIKSTGAEGYSYSQAADDFPAPSDDAIQSNERLKDLEGNYSRYLLNKLKDEGYAAPNERGNWVIGGDEAETDSLSSRGGSDEELVSKIVKQAGPAGFGESIEEDMTKVFLEQFKSMSS